MSGLIQIEQTAGVRAAVRYRCPACAAPVFAQPLGGSEVQAHLVCAGCARSYPVSDSIAQLITEADLAQHQPFVRHYLKVRAAEGPAMPAAAVWALPHLPRSAEYPAHVMALWRRRASAYARLIHLLDGLAQAVQRPLHVLDLGAGTCWLSAQLARRGHRVHAVDINLDPDHGLGMARQLARIAQELGLVGEGDRFISCVQAPIERLPYLDGQFDLVVAAASLHYARQLETAVSEAARVLRPGGALVLLDTPLYRTAAAGRAIVARRIAAQRRWAGSDAAGVTGDAFIERTALRRAFRRAGLEYHEIAVHSAPRAVAGRLRRWVRRAVRHREQAEMPLIVGNRGGSPC